MAAWRFPLKENIKTLSATLRFDYESLHTNGLTICTHKVPKAISSSDIRVPVGCIVPFITTKNHNFRCRPSTQSRYKRALETDLQGTPYEFVPFEDTSQVTLEFGWWKAHLKGEPYYMGALSVADLVSQWSSGIGDLLREFFNLQVLIPTSLPN